MIVVGRAVREHASRNVLWARLGEIKIQQILIDYVLFVSNRNNRLDLKIGASTCCREDTSVEEITSSLFFPGPRPKTPAN